MNTEDDQHAGPDHQHQDDHDHSDHGGGHHDDHGHAPERGWLAGFRYLKLIRKFWRSDVNVAVIDMIAPVSGERLLDIGAGMGAGAVVAVDRIDRGLVTAVDPLPGMRLFASLRRLKPGRRNLMRVMAGSAEDLPLESGTVDAAWATNALHHFDDITVAAGELARVTTAGARVVLVEEQFTDPTHPSYERFGGDDHGDHEHRFHAVDLEVMSVVFTTAGFEVIEASDATIAGVPAKLIRLRRSP